MAEEAVYLQRLRSGNLPWAQQAWSHLAERGIGDEIFAVNFCFSGRRRRGGSTRRRSLGGGRVIVGLGGISAHGNQK
jgi:hypothetical protein